MKKCKVCGKEIEDKYDYCLQCLNKVKELNTTQELINKVGDMIVINKMQNWNLGTISKVLKFYLIIELEKHGSGRTENQEKIYQFLVQYLDKDLTIVRDIKKEGEGR